MFENIVYNSYYQWVPLYLTFLGTVLYCTTLYCTLLYCTVLYLYLTFLAFFFYLPRYIWLKMEGGLMKLFRKGTTAR